MRYLYLVTLRLVMAVRVSTRLRSVGFGNAAEGVLLLVLAGRLKAVQAAVLVLRLRLVLSLVDAVQVQPVHGDRLASFLIDILWILIFLCRKFQCMLAACLRNALYFVGCFWFFQIWLTAAQRWILLTLRTQVILVQLEVLLGLVGDHGGVVRLLVGHSCHGHLSNFSVARSALAIICSTLRSSVTERAILRFLLRAKLVHSILQISIWIWRQRCLLSMALLRVLSGELDPLTLEVLIGLVLMSILLKVITSGVGGSLTLSIGIRSLLLLKIIHIFYFQI